MIYLYLHIPFCVSKCSYCSFNSYPGRELLYKDYVDALKKEIASIAGVLGKNNRLTSLFIGGGTPTVLSSGLLVDLVQYTKTVFNFECGAEVSIEANPGTVNQESLEELSSCGVNRISLGVQSFDDGELVKAGRRHTAKEAENAVRMAVESGFSNINIDLMSGLPGQTGASWRKSLEKAVSLGPQHLSLYELMFEPGTLMTRFKRENKFSFPDEDELEKIDGITGQICAENEFSQYEISNYARFGFECRHNINYWLNGDYFAAGAGSVSYFNGRREKRIDSPEEYIARIRRNRTVVEESENLSREKSFRETVIMGLRMKRGVSLSVVRERYGIEALSYYGETLKKLLALELLEVDKEYLRLTEKGWPLANSIMAELV
ncbi:coproporphyrinogen III oxidase [Desulfomarina profundi]|uniref:Heme chaperone HemW n=1 Tax=Desulfomarina profundi TaxID=2772557 RepID=A0A8D5FWQ1_9BACT|nr:radical SAM family heme chaperone HemW [Desulfomarina profundi]BCL62741.1 coproporphyrinogen III oxidase [Desulfomarina profundi]